MSGVATIVTKGGRLVLPAKVRSTLRIADGERVVIEVQPGGYLTVTPLRVKIQEVQKRMAKYKVPGVSMVDELLEARRQEFEREIAE